MKAMTITLGLVLTILSGCSGESVETQPQAGVNDDKMLVSVNGTPITEYDLAYWLRGAHGQEMTASMKKTALDNLVEGELVYQKGLELGFDKNELYRREIRKLELQLKALQRSEMLERVYNREVASKIEVTPDEVRQYYDEHVDRFGRNLHLGTLRFGDVAAAKAARERILSGESFEDLADESEDSQWDVGLLSWSRIPFEWHDIVYDLVPGEVSEVFEGGRTGIRLFKLLNAEESETAEFKDVHNSIMNRLRDARTHKAFKAYISKLRTDAEIVWANEQ